MAVVVHWGHGTQHHVIAVDVIDISVAVVIHAVVGNLTWIDPHVRLEVRVVVVDSAVDDRDAKVGIARPEVPSVDRSDVSAGLAGIAVDGLARV